jgi:hypothetical protein
MAVDAFLIPATDHVVVGIVVVGFVGALIHTNLTRYAFVLVSVNNELRFDVTLHLLTL